MMKSRGILLLALMLASICKVLAVDRTKFRTCQDALFCRSHRQPSSPSAYALTSELTLDTAAGRVSGELTDDLRLTVDVLKSGAVRVRVTEVSGDDGERWKPHDVLLPTALVPGGISALAEGDDKIPAAKGQGKRTAFQISSPDSDDVFVLVIYDVPLVIELFKNSVELITLNKRSLMHYQKTQAKTNSGGESLQELIEGDRHNGKEVVDYGEDGLAVYADGSKEVKKDAAVSGARSSGWSESFHEHVDTKPDGPKSVGLDMAFPFAQHVYGIPQHTTSLSLPTTAPGDAGLSPKYSQPYRMYALDVFEYELDETMALYGNIPLLIAHGLVDGKGTSAAAFWFNPSETFIDISDGGSSAKPYKESHWISESGDVDVFLLMGPSPKDVSRQFGRLMGMQQLPPLFALGYHQCRWNYRDERDVADVEATFEKLDFPYDVIWLDIEHTNGKRYFTWDKALFPNPKQMIDSLSSHGRKMVTIVDPHIKRDPDYAVHTEATDKGLYIKDKNGKDFDGWCWPGSSSYLDFTRYTPPAPIAIYMYKDVE
jgi:alpha 1,3-glucosidase